jgi:hypothetical protein
VEALQEGHAGGGGGVAGLLGIAGRGLLGQHVLAGGDRSQVPGAVEADAQWFWHLAAHHRV